MCNVVKKYHRENQLQGEAWFYSGAMATVAMDGGLDSGRLISLKDTFTGIWVSNGTLWNAKDESELEAIMPKFLAWSNLTDKKSELKISSLLINNDCFDSYKEYMELQDGDTIPSDIPVEEFFQYFNWEESSEGWDFWDGINQKWLSASKGRTVSYTI